MHILDRFQQLKENFYLDSMTESDTDLLEQADEEAPPEEPVQQEEPAEPQAQPQDMVDPEGGMDASMGDVEGEGVDEYGMQEEEIKTPTELGRVYELNKIYYRLYVINKFLKNTSDRRLQKVKKMVAEAFDIYRLILNNIKSYKDKVDEIILQYYEFISHLVIKLDEYYKHRFHSIKQSEEQN
jgi:hypothetical protein